MKKIYTTLFAMAVVAATTGALAVFAASPQVPNTSPPGRHRGSGAVFANPQHNPNVFSQGNLSLDRVNQIALDRVGGGTVARTETKYGKHGGMHYKVIIVSGDYKYDVKIDLGGNIIDLKMKQITTAGAKVFGYITPGIIDADKAKSIALEAAGGGIITDCKLDHKSREGMVYKLKVANGQMEYKVEMLAATGSIFIFHPKYKY